MGKFRLLIKKIAKQSLINYKRHFVKTQWRNAVKNHKTNYVLTKEQKNSIREFYKKYAKISYDFHEYYIGNTDLFAVEYIPDDLYYNYIDRFYNDWEKATLFDNKCMYGKYFANVLMPKTILLKMNGMFFNADYEVITKEQAEVLLAKENEIFIKAATESDGGRGVFCLTGDEIKEKAISIISSLASDVIVQESIKQHPHMALINDSSINSIRVLSLLRDNEVKVYSCVVRMGMKGSRVDNVSSGAISCGIDSNGRLRKYAYGCYGGRTETHPTSNLRFEGFEIPGYHRIIEITKKLHCQMPQFRLISWDYSVNEQEEPVLIEANFKYGALDFHQFGNGPVFGEDTKAILDEVFGK